MGEVKRYWPDGNGDAAYMIEHGSTSIADDEPNGYVRHSDYARLERERDQAMAAHADMVREVEASQAEMARLRAVEADYATLQGFMRDRMPALIAARLAADDGYDPEDQHGGLYDLRWTGGPTPEPEGDAWSMDYLPRGEKIAADLAEACGRKG